MKESYETITAQELDDVPLKPSAKDEHWGYHLLIDMSGCNGNIDNHHVIEKFIKEMIHELKMKPIGPTKIVSVNNEEGRGTTAVQVITTSTITFHGDDDKRCVYLDVFSCKPYEPKIVFDSIKRHFAPKRVGYKWIYRDAGSWPKSEVLDKAETIIKTPSQLKFPVFLMNFPFTVSNDNPNNAWMTDKSDYNYEKAFSQFMDLYHYIAEYALVYVLPSEGDFQDQPFVANLGCYLPHIKDEDTILVANFKSKPRVGEDGPGTKFFKSMGYKVIKPPFKWEGEADLKYIRNNIYFSSHGIRTELKSHNWMSDNLNMEVISIKLDDEKLYHFDCVFFPITDQKAMVATSVLDPEDVKAIEKVMEIVDVPKEHIYDGWTNAVLLGDKILHTPHKEDTSVEAFKKFIDKLGYEPVLIDLSEFEKSGADLSCMLMHLNYNNRKASSLFKKSTDFWWAERIGKLPVEARTAMLDIAKSNGRIEWWLKNNLVNRI